MSGEVAEASPQSTSGISRRSALKAAFSFLTRRRIIGFGNFAFSGVAGGAALAEYQRRAEEAASKARAEVQLFDLRRKIFLPESHTRSHIVMAQDNPWVKSIFQGKATDTARRMAGSFIKGAEEFTEASEELPLQAHATSVILGSPSSNALARSVFEYTAEDRSHAHAGFRRISHHKAVIQTRWDFACVKGETFGPKASFANRLVTGPDGQSSSVSIPVWGILDHHSSSSTYLKGEVDMNGNLQNDYLLITHIPNVFDAHALRDGMFMTFVGGPNSLGSLGINKLNNSEHLLSELLEKTEGMLISSWQALYYVSRIGNDLDVGLIDFHAMEINFGTIEQKLRGGWGRSTGRLLSD